MVWSGYRASDDATKLGYNIPGNMFLVWVVEFPRTLHFLVAFLRRLLSIS
jgi:meiotically up-regulated gene 157 (Mug157) protein